MLSELTGTHIAGQYELIAAMRDLSRLKEEYEGVRDAFTAVRMKGYGVVSPKKEEIVLEEPAIIKQGNKFGVKIHSEAPSIHLIRARRPDPLYQGCQGERGRHLEYEYFWQIHRRTGDGWHAE